MDFLNRKKRQNKAKQRNEVTDVDARVQFNMTISPELKRAVQHLAKTFRAPMFTVTEHLLQTGLYYVLKAIKDDEMRLALEKHLIDRHLLEIRGNDEETLIKMAEGDRAWQLVSFAKKVIKNFRELEFALRVAKKTGDDSLFKQKRNELNISILEMADWVVRHGLESLGDESDHPEN